ncbi:uncharacterized protein N7500_010321 [Penicillium coprophilum]|uniref:uncharacterized protein n=1 Tax=Penicillium coprophilum TaxID=36646 RepID=UPI00239BF30B|nr:uncharacterized protein N7500_010321 [Penicillium coprophilum]KAJ5154882.1 hypothetical protein N7500_010321 [Penicillium coprophilum]
MSNIHIVWFELDWIGCRHCWKAISTEFHTKDGTPVDSFMATMNAQTYAYFAVAYWYSLQEWGGKKRVSFFDGAPESAEELG